MSETDFSVAVLGASCPEVSGKGVRLFCTPSKQELVQHIIGEHADSLLVMAIVDSIQGGKEVSQDLFPNFAENVTTPPGTYTQFTLQYADSASGDLIEYRCERLSDIGAIIEEEGGEHLCSTICATTVSPNNDTFDFIDSRLTLITCTQHKYDADCLAVLAHTAAEVIGCQVSRICVYLPGRSLLSSPPARLGSAVLGLRAECAGRTFGIDVRPSGPARLRDVRVWAQAVNEQYRFAPAAPGPYFVSLDPRLVVGEKLMHPIPEDVTYLVGEGGVASAWDFVALSSAAEQDVLHPSVYSPHCRFRREGDAVWLKPECGVTYLNGCLLKEDTQLRDNDRVIIGKQLAFRYVVVTASAPMTSRSRILDWELCSKEFREQSHQKLTHGEKSQLEADNKDLTARLAALERELAHARGNAWLILSNPPGDYQGPALWPLDLSGETGGEVTIGPRDATVAVPFLTSSASLKRDRSLLLFQCCSVSFPLVSGSRFTIGGYSFVVSLPADATPKMLTSAKLESAVPGEGDELTALRLTCFDLQWATALLFDFAFPPDMTDAAGRRVEDEYAKYRKELCRDAIMTSDAMSLAQLTALNRQLVGTIRMIGAGMAKEVNCAYIGHHDKNSAARAASRHDGKLGANTTDFFVKATKADALSAELLQRFHAEAGALLLSLNTFAPSRSNGEASSPKKPAKKKSKSPVKKVSVDYPATQSAEASVPSLGNLSLLLSSVNTGGGGGGGGGADDNNAFDSRLTTLKGFAFLTAPQVIRRAAYVMDTLSARPHPKFMWDKYYKTLCYIPLPEGSLVLRQNYYLAMLDVIITTDFCAARGLLSKVEMKQVDLRIDQWQVNLVNFASAFDEPGQQRRAAWRREAALQKGTTPRLRPSSVKAGSTGAAGSPNGAAAAPARARSPAGRGMPTATPSARRSSSKGLDSKPKCSSSSSAPAGRTPVNLNSFSETSPPPCASRPTGPRAAPRSQAASALPNHGTTIPSPMKPEEPVPVLAIAVASSTPSSARRSERLDSARGHRVTEAARRH